MGKKKFGIRLVMSKNTVRHYIQSFHAMKTTTEEPLKLPDVGLNCLFHPPKEVIGNSVETDPL